MKWRRIIFPSSYIILNGRNSINESRFINFPLARKGRTRLPRNFHIWPREAGFFIPRCRLATPAAANVEQKTRRAWNRQLKHFLIWWLAAGRLGRGVTTIVEHYTIGLYRRRIIAPDRSENLNGDDPLAHWVATRGARKMRTHRQ